MRGLTSLRRVHKEEIDMLALLARERVDLDEGMG